MVAIGSGGGVNLDTTWIGSLTKSWTNVFSFSWRKLFRANFVVAKSDSCVWGRGREMCVREREECGVCVCEREREECGVCVCERERERSVVCVCERERTCVMSTNNCLTGSV